MKLLMFVIYDSKVDAYLHPMFFRSVGEAMRAFGDSANDQSTQFAKHPADFTLFHIGDFEEKSGTLIQMEAKANLGTALQLQRQTPSEAAPTPFGNVPKQLDITDEIQKRTANK